MLLALVHLKNADGRTRSRAFDLTCRLTASFCNRGVFTCEGRPLPQWHARAHHGATSLFPTGEGRPLPQWRPLYTASLPAPVLLRQHVRAVLKAAATQCSTLGPGVVGEALHLLMPTDEEGVSFECPLRRAQVLDILQVVAPWFVNIPLSVEGDRIVPHEVEVVAPWFVNIPLSPLPPIAPLRSATFIFLRRLSLVALSRSSELEGKLSELEGRSSELEGEALSAYYDAWSQLAAASVGVAAAMRAPPCAQQDEKAPPNVTTILEFLLHTAGRSHAALELAQQIVLGLFTLAPHTTLGVLLEQVTQGVVAKPTRRVLPPASAGGNAATTEVQRTLLEASTVHRGSSVVARYKLLLEASGGRIGDGPMEGVVDDDGSRRPMQLASCAEKRAAALALMVELVRQVSFMVTECL